MTDDFISQFTDAAASVANDKQKQFEILSSRKRIVQNNVESFNGLYSQLTEILTVGKILYKPADHLKLKEYTFSELRKRVRQTNRPSPATKKDQTN